MDNFDTHKDALVKEKQSFLELTCLMSVDIGIDKRYETDEKKYAQSKAEIVTSQRGFFAIVQNKQKKFSILWPIEDKNQTN